MSYDAPAFDGNRNIPIFTRIIPGFPYPERNCPFCERQLEPVNAIHAKDAKEIFKCIFLCQNPECGAFDMEGNTAYMRAYYSSQLALELFETIFLRYRNEVKE